MMAESKKSRYAVPIRLQSGIHSSSWSSFKIAQSCSNLGHREWGALIWGPILQLRHYSHLNSLILQTLFDTFEGSDSLLWTNEVCGSDGNY